MTITGILVHKAIGETRAVALDRAGAAVALFSDRWALRGKQARWGDVLTGRLTKFAGEHPDSGDGFVTLDMGEEVFLQARDRSGLHEGQQVSVTILAEARQGKLARTRRAAPGTAPEVEDLFTRWRASLPGGGAAELSEGVEEIDAVFSAALDPDVTLPGGGKLRITRTPSLIAVDIDTAGRTDKGRAGKRALAINRIAAETTARELALRSLGGAIVIDCVAPLTKGQGGEVKQAFLDTVRAITSRQAAALAPSPFGLLEATLAWRWQPLADMVLSKSGAPSHRSLLLATLRAAERDAIANRSAQYDVSVPRAWEDIAPEETALYQSALNERFGARVRILRTDQSHSEVTPR